MLIQNVGGAGAAAGQIVEEVIVDVCAWNCFTREAITVPPSQIHARIAEHTAEVIEGDPGESIRRDLDFHVVAVGSHARGGPLATGISCIDRWRWLVAG